MLENQRAPNNLKDKIFDKKKNNVSVIDVYHYLMIHYGYIPFEEFKKMDAFLVDELVNRLNKMNEESSKNMPKGRRGRMR